MLRSYILIQYKPGNWSLYWWCVLICTTEKKCPFPPYAIYDPSFALLLSATSCRNVQHPVEMYSSEGWPEKSDIHDTYKDVSIGDRKINSYPKSMSGRQKGFTGVEWNIIKTFWHLINICYRPIIADNIHFKLDRCIMLYYWHNCSGLLTSGSYN